MLPGDHDEIRLPAADVDRTRDRTSNSLIACEAA
jgi:hypothetical protein